MSAERGPCAKREDVVTSSDQHRRRQVGASAWQHDFACTDRAVMTNRAQKFLDALRAKRNTAPPGSGTHTVLQAIGNASPPEGRQSKVIWSTAAEDSDEVAATMQGPDGLVLIADVRNGAISFQLPGRPSGSTGSFGSPQRTTKPVAEPTWFPPGSTAKVGRLTIDGGMLYVGESPYSPDYSWNTSCTIDDTLPVSFGHSRLDEQVGYYPSYERLSPEQRGMYLQWLAAGRLEDFEDQWCLFLFLYGIERRLFADIDPTTGSEEINAMYREVDQLLSRFAHRHSFARYAGSLLNLLDVLLLSLGVAPPERTVEVPQMLSWELPALMQLEAAAAAKRGLPLSPEIALHIVRHHPARRLRTPATRCVEQFDQLFIERYTTQFGDGIVLKSLNKTKLSFVYRPSARGPRWRSLLFHSSALGTLDPSGGELQLQFTKAAGLQGEVKITLGDLSPALDLNSVPVKLSSLAHDCEEALAKYSRYLISKDVDPERARSLLPPELRRPLPAASQVNLNVVADLLAADRVTTILENRLNDESDDVLSDLAFESEPSVASDLAAANLDDAHWKLARALAARPSWSKADAATLASSVGLEFLNLALATINETALERTGVVFAQGDDPIAVDAEIYEEMNE
jgi:hypothetical protein